MTDEEQDKSPEIYVPENESDLLARLEEKRGEELTEKEANVAIAQAKLIGDL